MAPTSGDAMVATIRREVAALADPERAVGQQRYMKSVLPFHGATSAQVRSVVRSAVAAHPLPSRADWFMVILTLWDQADHREQRYAALGVLRHSRYRAWARTVDDALLTMLRHMVVTGAWWDLVDETAHVVGEALAADPTTMKPLLRQWATETDLWLRRVAILSQLWAKHDTDRDLLSLAIDGSLDDRDFFARKAIGWALRVFAATDPDWVRQFVERQRPRLSGVSLREARKGLERAEGATRDTRR